MSRSVAPEACVSLDALADAELEDGADPPAALVLDAEQIERAIDHRAAAARLRALRTTTTQPTSKRAAA